MKISKAVFFGMWILVAMSIGAGMVAADDLESGVLGIAWKSSPDDNQDLTFLYKTDSIAYYFQLDTVYTIKEIPIHKVVFGFVNDQFFTASVHVANEEIFGSFRRYLTSRYGSPAKTFSTKSEETVYNWKHKEVRIELKTIEKDHQMRLSFYYTPLSSKMDKEVLKEIRQKAVRVLPITREGRPEMLPLLQF
jgi:hypothetical protein